MKEETTDYTVSEETDPTEIKTDADSREVNTQKETEKKSPDVSITLSFNFKDVFFIVFLVLMVIYFFRGCEILLKRIENRETSIESVESPKTEK